MKIAVDMENVLAAPKTWFLEVYNDRHGTDYRNADVTHWDWVQVEIAFDEFMETIQTGLAVAHRRDRSLKDDL